MTSWQQDENCSNHYFQENKSGLPKDFFIIGLSGLCDDYNQCFDSFEDQTGLDWSIRPV
jgi:hypothetical protein